MEKGTVEMLAMNRTAKRNVTASPTNSAATMIVVSKRCGFAMETTIAVTDRTNRIVVNENPETCANRPNSNVPTNVSAFHSHSNVTAPMIVVTVPMRSAVFNLLWFNLPIPTKLSNEGPISN